MLKTQTRPHFCDMLKYLFKRRINILQLIFEGCQKVYDINILLEYMEKTDDLFRHHPDESNHNLVVENIKKNKQQILDQIELLQEEMKRIETNISLYLNPEDLIF